MQQGAQDNYQLQFTLKLQITDVYKRQAFRTLLGDAICTWASVSAFREFKFYVVSADQWVVAVTGQFVAWGKQG